MHKATLLDGTKVAVKIQYPTVADSIESDLNNLKMLVNMTNILPPGLFIDSIIKVINYIKMIAESILDLLHITLLYYTVKVASEELSAECNYSTEAISQIRSRSV